MFKPSQDDIVDLHGIRGGERGPENNMRWDVETTKKTNYLRPREQFVHEDPEGPEVHSLVVPLVEDDLGSHVLGGPAECPRLVAGVD